MKIGSLYLAKSWYWLLFPSKEVAFITSLKLHCLDASAVDRNPVQHADYYGKIYNCEIVVFSPNEYIVILEEDENFKKILTLEGKIGWIWFGEYWNVFFDQII